MFTAPVRVHLDTLLYPSFVGGMRDEDAVLTEMNDWSDAMLDLVFGEFRVLGFAGVYRCEPTVRGHPCGIGVAVLDREPDLAARRALVERLFPVAVVSRTEKDDRVESLQPSLLGEAFYRRHSMLSSIQPDLLEQLLAAERVGWRDVAAGRRRFVVECDEERLGAALDAVVAKLTPLVFMRKPLAPGRRCVGPAYRVTMDSATGTAAIVLPSGAAPRFALTARHVMEAGTITPNASAELRCGCMSGNVNCTCDGVQHECTRRCIATAYGPAACRVVIRGVPGGTISSDRRDECVGIRLAAQASDHGTTTNLLRDIHLVPRSDYFGYNKGWRVASRSRNEQCELRLLCFNYAGIVKYIDAGEVEHTHHLVFAVQPTNGKWVVPIGGDSGGAVTRNSIVHGVLDATPARLVKRLSTRQPGSNMLYAGHAFSFAMAGWVPSADEARVAKYSAQFASKYGAAALAYFRQHMRAVLNGLEENGVLVAHKSGACDTLHVKQVSYLIEEAFAYFDQLGNTENCYWVVTVNDKIPVLRPAGTGMTAPTPAVPPVSAAKRPKIRVVLSKSAAPSSSSASAASSSASS